MLHISFYLLHAHTKKQKIEKKFKIDRESPATEEIFKKICKEKKKE